MFIMNFYYIFIIASVIFFERGRDIIDYLIRHYC
nr:MAG TPA: induced Fungus-induced protein [Caudoviricetes sp.]